MDHLENHSKHGGSVLGNLTIRFRQSASALALIGCSSPPWAAPRHVTAAGSVALAGTSKSPPEPAATATTHSEAPLTEPPSSLAVDGFEPSVIRLPADGKAAPLFVVAHGAGGQASWHCHHYEAMLGPSAALLCLTGKRMVTRDPTRGYYYPDHIWLSDELMAAYASMSRSHANVMLGSSRVYIGYSQGASMGVLAVAAHGDLWPRLALVEGGYDAWSASLARTFHDHGGQRVLFVCGTEHCRKQARQAVMILERTGVMSRLLTAPNAGHRPDGPVAARVNEGLVWLLQDEPRYENVLRYLSTSEVASPS